MKRKHIKLSEKTLAWYEQYTAMNNIRSARNQLSASQAMVDVLERFSKNEITLTSVEASNIEDRVINPITGIILKLEKEEHPDIDSYIELLEKVMTALSDYGLIGKRKPYLREGNDE